MNSVDSKQLISIPGDVWSVIAQFVDIKDLPNILVLSRGINNLVNSDLSWEKRCKQNFPIDQIVSVRGLLRSVHQGNEEFMNSIHQYIYRDLMFTCASRDVVFPNFSNSLNVDWNVNNNEHVERNETNDSFRFLELYEVKYMNSPEVNKHLRDWFDCEENTIPSLDISISSIGKERLIGTITGYTDIAFGLVRFILPNYHSRLTKMKYSTASVSTCYGCYYGKNVHNNSSSKTFASQVDGVFSDDNVLFFTSSWAIDCGYISSEHVETIKRGNPFYCLGQSTMLYPPNEDVKEDEWRVICKEFQAHHRRIYGKEYRLKESVRSRIPKNQLLSNEIHRTFEYSFDLTVWKILFPFKSEVFGDEDGLRRIRKEKKVLSRKGKLIFGIKEVKEYQFDYIRGRYIQESPEKKEFSVTGSIMKEYVSMVVNDWFGKMDEFYLGGKFVYDEEGESVKNVFVTGVVVISKFMGWGNTKPKIDGVFTCD